MDVEDIVMDPLDPEVTEMLLPATMKEEPLLSRVNDPDRLVTVSVSVVLLNVKLLSHRSFRHR